MPSHMQQEKAEPWCVTCGIRCKRLLNSQAWQQTILDHQEFMGEEMGRRWLLQALQRAWHVWNKHSMVSAAMVAQPQTPTKNYASY